MSEAAHIPSGRIEQSFLDRIKERISLVTLIGSGPNSVALKKKKSGKDWVGLCPFHHEKHGSFYVVEAKGFWHCFGCGAGGDCFKWVMATTTAGEFREAVEYLAHKAGLWGTGPQLDARPLVKRANKEARDADRANKIGKAIDIWRGAGSPLGTPAERYLRGRHIRLALPPTLRFHSGLEHPHLWPYFPRGKAPKFPALVGAVQGCVERPDGGMETRAIVGVHCTFLAPDGSGKAARPPQLPPGEEWKTKIMRGAVWGGALRLTAAEDIMLVAEGIETAFSVLQACWDDELGCAHIDGQPVGVWATLSQNNLGAVWLPDSVREVRLCIDNDTKIPNAENTRQKDPEEIIAAAVTHHRAQGRDVRIARPPAGMDFNDMLAPGAGFDAVAEDAA